MARLLEFVMFPNSRHPDSGALLTSVFVAGGGGVALDEIDYADKQKVGIGGRRLRGVLTYPAAGVSIASAFNVVYERCFTVFRAIKRVIMHSPLLTHLCLASTHAPLLLCARPCFRACDGAHALADFAIAPFRGFTSDRP